MKDETPRGGYSSFSYRTVFLKANQGQTHSRVLPFAVRNVCRDRPATSFPLLFPAL